MASYCSILIKNGRLVSSHYDSEKKDILIKDGKIKEIDDRIDCDCNCKIIDASNLVVSPGFINIHSHDDFYLQLENHAQIMKSLAYQGITTSVGGNCGISSYPYRKESRKNLDSYQGFLHFEKPEYKWESLKDYINLIKGKILFNFIPLIGHGTLRVICNGFEKSISRQNMNKMKDLLIECFEQGALGISSGLMYMPGNFSKTEELIELCSIAAGYPGTIYSTHLRGYSDTYIESVQESIKIGKASGIKVQISHLGPFGVSFGPQIYKVLEMIEKARKEDVDILFDSLAYCGGSTTIMAIIPPWAYAEGLQKFIVDIKNDEFFNKVVDYMENYVPKWPSWEGVGWTDNFVRSLGWENLYILSAKNPEFIGKNFSNIARIRNISRNEALRQVLIEEKGTAIMYMAGIGSCLNEKGDMSYFDAMIESPFSLIAVDALFSSSGKTMPFTYGTFPRIINRYIKSKKTLTLKEAVEKFTNKVAERFELKNRGVLKKGAYADIVIFDIEKVKDYPDIFADKPKLSTGVIYLMVNGEILIDKEVYLKSLSGRIIT